jgi:flagellar basal body-associated protein FliL
MVVKEAANDKIIIIIIIIILIIMIMVMTMIHFFLFLMLFPNTCAAYISFCVLLSVA